MHTPVLLKQAIDNLEVKKEGMYIDATFGEGGYTKEILARGGKVLALDLDPNQVSETEVKDPNLILAAGNFADMERIAKENRINEVDGVVFDLGLSMEQLDFGGRGLSYNKPEEPLDMRIGDSEVTAEDIIIGSTEDELFEILARGSEDINSQKIAKELKSGKKLRTVGDLTRAIDKALGYKSRGVYARIFQALRIEVNREFDNLRKGLAGAKNLLKRDGRIVVVSFHSLEDRIVKNFGKTNGFKFKNNSKVREERRSFERSAKVRKLYYE